MPALGQGQSTCAHTGGNSSSHTTQTPSQNLLLCERVQQFTAYMQATATQTQDMARLGRTPREQVCNTYLDVRTCGIVYPDVMYGPESNMDLRATNLQGQQTQNPTHTHAQQLRMLHICRTDSSQASY
jgi:hypothetical protein